MDTAVLLHGWGTSPVRLEPLRTALEAEGIAARQWTYTPRGSVHELAGELAADLGDRPVHLVGHSLGGLVCASAVLDHGVAACSVTTLNTPWRGTWVAWTADRGDPLGHQLRWRAGELERLRTSLAAHLAAGQGPRWHVVSALGDLAAPPTGALRVPEGDRLVTRLVPARGHSISLFAPPMIDAVRELLVPAA